MSAHPARVLRLRVRVTPERQAEFLAFLREARPYYESIGGVRMRLMRDLADPSRFVEVFEYDSVESFERDDARVRLDPEMGRWLGRWRSLLDGPPEVEVAEDLSALTEP